jgi:hypothetical protein
MSYITEVNTFSLRAKDIFLLLEIPVIIIIIIIIIISCHRFSFFPGTSALEPVVNPTTQALCDVPSMAVFVWNLLSVVLVLFPDIFVNFCSQFRWPQ